MHIKHYITPKKHKRTKLALKDIDFSNNYSKLKGTFDFYVIFI